MTRSWLVYRNTQRVAQSLHSLDEGNSLVTVRGTIHGEMKPSPPVATEELLFLTCPPLMSPLVRGRQLSPTSQQTLSVTESPLMSLRGGAQK